MIAFAIAVADAVGAYDIPSAAIPATAGVLAEVPQKSAKPPPRTVVTSHPGAATGTQLP